MTSIKLKEIFNFLLKKLKSFIVTDFVSQPTMKKIAWLSTQKLIIIIQKPRDKKIKGKEQGKDHRLGNAPFSRCLWSFTFY